jgi:hypothetical protein
MINIVRARCIVGDTIKYMTSYVATRRLSTNAKIFDSFTDKTNKINKDSATDVQVYCYKNINVKKEYTELMKIWNMDELCQLTIDDVELMCSGEILDDKDIDIMSSVLAAYPYRLSLSTIVDVFSENSIEKMIDVVDKTEIDAIKVKHVLKTMTCANKCPNKKCKNAIKKLT